MSKIKEYLIHDINNLDEHDIRKLYIYVRTHLIANIPGLQDPLEWSYNKDCAVPSPFETTPKSCTTCNSKGMDAYECYCCKQNELCYYEAQDFAQS